LIFIGVDPLAEKYFSVSPYVYCKNNPVNYIDPNGEFSTHFGAWLHKFLHGGGGGGGGGGKIEQNNFKQHFYTKDLKGEAGVAAVYGSNGVKGKPDQQNGASIFGTASSQLMELGTSLFHEASIDMKEASNDAIDMWAKILKSSSSENKIQNQKEDIKEEVIDVGIVTDVDGDAVEWESKSGLHRFNATGVRVNDTILKQRILKTIRNGKVMKKDTLLYDTYPIGK